MQLIASNTTISVRRSKPSQRTQGNYTTLCYVSTQHEGETAALLGNESRNYFFISLKKELNEGDSFTLPLPLQLESNEEGYTWARVRV